MIRLLTILILWSSLESCGILHKTFDRKKESHSERIKSSTDSAGKKTNDSSGIKSVDSASLKKKEEAKSTDVEIEFSDSSDHNKVEITTDSTGKQVIKAEGKIKTVKSKTKDEKKSLDSSHLQKKDTASKKTFEQTAVKKTTDNKQTGSSTTTHKKKFEFRIPWYAYLIGIIVLIISILYLWKRYRYKIIAWIIQLRNPGSKVYYDPKIKGYQVIYKKRKPNTS